MIFIFNPFFNEISMSKQNSSRWDAAFCNVTSGVMLFAFICPIKRTPGLYELRVITTSSIVYNVFISGGKMKKKELSLHIYYSKFDKHQNFIFVDRTYL